MLKANFKSALGLDIGERRIGVARVNVAARLPEPLVTLSNDANFVDKLRQLIDEYTVDTLVVGLPRNMSGGETEQSEWVRSFVGQYLSVGEWPVICWQDETLSTHDALERYSQKDIQKFGIDSLAATEILDDFIRQEK